jgi:hypothetical protein
MTIVNMNVQGADGISRDVPLDSIVGQDYDVPVYKLTIGDEGDDDGMVSATNPLPVTVNDAPLPDDAATATNQETIIGHVDGIETLLADVSTETTLSALNTKIVTNAADTARTTDTVVLPVQFVDSAGRSPKTDGITRALMTMDYAHHEMHSGSFYFVKGWSDVDGAGTNLDFLWVVPDSTAWPHSQWSLAGEAEFTLYLYEGVTTANNGSGVATRNANRNHADASGVLAYSAPTLSTGTLGDGANGGTLIWSGKIGSGRNATSGRNTNHELIGRQNTKYWFRITKEASGTAWLDYEFNWYEHTNS